MKNTGAPIRDLDGQMHPFAKFSLRNSSSSFCSVGERGTSLWGAWHWDGALWHDPMPYEGEGGQRLPLRRHLQSLCSILGWCFQMTRLVGLEPPLPISVRGSKWCRSIPPTLG